jgi:hypothetical protein
MNLKAGTNVTITYPPFRGAKANIVHRYRSDGVYDLKITAARRPGIVGQILTLSDRGFVFVLDGCP